MGEGAFRSREAGEVIHHASNVNHAMRTGEEPLLALYIWRGGPLAQKLDDHRHRRAGQGLTMAKAIMLQGTGSDVGKTVLVAGLCRAAQEPRAEGPAVQAAEHVEQCRRRRHSRRRRRRRDRPGAMAAGDGLRRARRRST